MKRRAVAAAVIAAAALPTAGFAQAHACRVPATLPRPHLDGPGEREPARRLGIGGYTLALTWSPQYCRTRLTGARDAPQCGGRDGPLFGWTLHGLWPDGPGAVWPQYCRPAALLPAPLVRRTFCATPSPQLQQHEWAKHGTCMTTRPQEYFARSTAMYGALRFPDTDALSRGEMTAGRLAQAFASANRGMSADMLRVTSTRDGWLEELWLCRGRDFAPRRCPAHQGGLPPGAPIKIWRGRR